jgi:cold shock CspA family protein
MKVEEFLAANPVEAHAAAKLRSAPPHVQEAVLAWGSIVDKPSRMGKTGVLISRIKNAEAAGAPPPAPVGTPSVPGVSGPTLVQPQDAGTSVGEAAVEEFLAANPVAPTAPAAAPAAPAAQGAREICKYFPRCQRGADCWFVHDVDARPVSVKKQDCTGIVKSYNVAQKFGFITCEDVPPPDDVYVCDGHLVGRDALAAGETVTFDLVEDDGRPQARNVRFIQDSGDFKPLSMKVEEFLAANPVRGDVAAELRNAPPVVQEAVLAKGVTQNARDPSAVLMSRIGKAKKAQAAGPPPPAPVGTPSAPGVFPILEAHATLTQLEVGETTSHVALAQKSCAGS